MPDLTTFTVYDKDGSILGGPFFDVADAQRCHSQQEELSEVMATHYKELAQDCIESTITES